MDAKALKLLQENPELDQEVSRALCLIADKVRRHDWGSVTIMTKIGKGSITETYTDERRTRQM